MKSMMVNAFRKESQKNIDKCLNCSKPFCSGECEDIIPKTKGFLIKRTKKYKNGKTKVSYFLRFSNEKIQTSKNPEKGIKFSNEYATKFVKKMNKKNEKDLFFEKVEAAKEIKKWRESDENN